MSSNYKSERVHLCIYSFSNSALMYILIDDKSVFDSITLPEGGNAAFRHKSLLDGPQQIVFQHWIPSISKIDQACWIEAFRFKQFVASSQKLGASL